MSTAAVRSVELDERERPVVRVDEVKRNNEAVRVVEDGAQPVPQTTPFVGPVIRPRTVIESERQISAMTEPGEVMIESPQPREILPSGDIEVFISTKGGTSDPRENKFHVFLDNEPPFLHEDERRPVLFHSLSEGGHVVRVVSVYDNGRARPLPGSYAATRFFIKRKDFKNFVDFSKPYITVNLPLEGIVAKDEQNRVCFDFLVHNAELGKEYQLQYTLDGEKRLIAKPSPVYWENLPEGLHQLKAELMDADGKPVLNFFSRAVRNFELPRILPPLLDEYNEWEDEDEYNLYLDELGEP